MNKDYINCHSYSKLVWERQLDRKIYFCKNQRRYWERKLANDRNSTSHNLCREKIKMYSEKITKIKAEIIEKRELVRFNMKKPGKRRDVVSLMAAMAI